MKWSLWRLLAAIPALAMALVSHIAICPACWPFVGGLMSASGAASLIEGPFMPPLFVGSLLLAIIPLGFEARRYITPFLIGLIGCFLALSGKFMFDTPGVTLGGIALLTGAYVWSYRVRRDRKGESGCATCVIPEPTAVEQTFRNASTDMPVACALDKTQFAERKALVDRLTQGAIERKGVPNGFAIRFGPEPGLVSELASFIELERACCPFLSFRIDVNTGGTVWLELTGPAAAQEIIWELIPTT